MKTKLNYFNLVKVLICLFLFLTPFLLIPYGKILYANDWEYMGLKPDLKTKTLEQSWNIYSQRFNWFQSRLLINSIFEFVYNLVGKNFEFFQKTSIGLLLVMQYLSINYFLSMFKIENKWIKYVILPFIYLFNPYTLICWAFGYFQILMLYALIPIFFFLVYTYFMDYIKDNKINYLKILALGLLIPLFSLIIPDISPLVVIFSIYLVMVIFLFIKYDTKTKKFLIFSNIIFLLFWLIPNLYWIKNFIVFLTTPGLKEYISTYSDLGYYSLNFKYSTFVYSLRGLGMGASYLKYNGEYYLSLLKIYDQNILLIFLGFFVFSIQFMLYFLLSKEAKKNAWLFIIWLLFLVLILGFNPPFGFINKLLYNLWIYKILRNAYIKTMIVWWLPLLPLLGFWLQFLYNKNKKYFFIILTINILFFLPVLTNSNFLNFTITQPVHEEEIIYNSTIQIPNFYEDINTYFSKLNDINSILYVPISYQYYKYNWGYGGSSIIRYFLPLENNVYGQYDHTIQILNIDQGNFDSIFNTDINYVLVDKTIDKKFWRLDQMIMYNRLIEFLNNKSIIKKVVDNENYSIYKIINHNSIEAFDDSNNLLNNSFKYKKESTTSYIINTNSSIKKIKLYNQFDPKWEVKLNNKKIYSKKSDDNYNLWIFNETLEPGQLKIEYEYQENFEAFKMWELYYYILLSTFGIIYLIYNWRKEKKNRKFNNPLNIHKIHHETHV